MGSLIPFLGGDRTAGLQPARGRLVKVDGELGGLTDGELPKLRGIAADLEGKLAKASDATQAYDEAVAHDATLVIERLRAGLSGVWGAVGGKARRIGETLIASETDRRIAESALAAVRLEIEQLEAKVEALEVEKAAAIDATIVESIAAGFRAELTEALETAQVALTRLEAVQHATGTQSAEYRPVKRAAVIVTDAVSGDHELVIETREVAKSLSVIEAFKTALQHDPLAAAPIFPDLDLSIDPDFVYHELRASASAPCATLIRVFSRKLPTRPSRQFEPLNQNTGTTTMTLAITADADDPLIAIKAAAAKLRPDVRRLMASASVVVETKS